MVGTMSYAKGEVAFFDGSSALYRKAVKIGETIAGHKVVAVTPDEVRMEADGKPVTHADTEPFETKVVDGKGGHDAAKLVAFLKQHEAKPLVAADVLATALATAQKEQKRVFLHFGAPWCVWCRRLEAWMAEPAVRERLDRDLVDVAIDVDRMEGGPKLKDDLGGGKSGGIPWFVILDASGKPLITSDGPGGNIGFPSAPEEVEHFGAMLRKGQSHLDEAAVKTILESLKAKPVSGSH